MPQLVTVRVKRPDRRPIRIWVPVLPAALVFAPIVILAVLGVVVACVVFHVDVVRALGTGWRIISALPGTRFDIEQDRTAVLVIIR
ncbi:hypothetical protein Acor_29270 [Acrocarpospora corrugata]|uniref:Uncharacterized protein n=2 Tax=Acrocarpospora corrugata TaxID=35763 RepID=A0A5M3W0P1_9ACTN|nr:hypothetical protein Acor_29270 [Acrocarpospora corrugata]